MNVSRSIKEQLHEALQQQPIVALVGPRLNGKTTIAWECAQQFPIHYIDLSDLDDQSVLAHPKLFLSEFENKLVILDEVFRAPELIPNLRELANESRGHKESTTRFLIVESASLNLLPHSVKPFAAGIEVIQLNPLSALEVGEENIDELWFRGGLPLSYCRYEDSDSLIWRKKYMRGYFAWDIPRYSPRTSADVIERLWSLLAQDHSTLLNASQLAISLGITSTTVSRHLDLLSELFLVRKLRSLQLPSGARTVKSPKVYIRDSGLLHALLNLESKEELLGHRSYESSWEGFVIEQICCAAEDRATPMFYRTVDGAEIDLILEWHQTSELWAIEIERSLERPVSRGFINSIDVLKPRRSFVVCMQHRPVLRHQDVEVLSLPEFLKLLSCSFA